MWGALQPTQNPDSVVFWDELPIPRANLGIYQQVYALEQWLRRIAYAALMIQHGSQWTGALPSDLSSILKQRLRQLRGRVYLDCENSDNAIWLLTLEELRSTLLLDGNWSIVRKLTNWPQEVLHSKINELRQIRNVVSHNRAVGSTTSVITDAVEAALQSGIDSFRDQLIYDSGKSEILLPEHEDDPEKGVPALFAEMVHGNNWSTFQPMLSRSEYFYSVTRLPAGPFEDYLGIKDFLAKLGPFEHEILAVLVNKTGNEFTLTWPRQADLSVHEEILRFFFGFNDHTWTRTPYESQSPSAICDPRIWFYENQRPLSE